MPRKVANEDILQKASELFAQRGYHEVQMDDVARETGVAKGTLYNHFRSKENLYLTIIQQSLATLAHQLEKVYSQSEDSWKNLHNFITHWESFMVKRRHFFCILRKSDSRLMDLKDAKGTLVNERIRKVLCDLLTEGMSKGEFRKMDVNDTCDAILGLAEGQVRSLIERNRTGRVDAGPTLDLLRFGMADGREF